MASPNRLALVFVTVTIFVTTLQKCFAPGSPPLVVNLEQHRKPGCG
jgi:hypothetical protein